MKHFPISYLPVMLIIFLMLILGCSEDSPTEPKEEGIKTLSTKTITSSGGSIKTDNIEIVIPSGAFSTSQEIKILESTDENLFSTNVVSDFFVLEGLPTEFAEPIKVKIKSTGTLSDSAYISVGEHNFISSLNEETTAYNLISAKDSSGFIIATIPPMMNQSLGKSSNNSSIKVDNLSINLGAIAGYVSYKSEQGHFKINTPSSVITQAYDLADYLETAYSKFESIGFSYSRRTKWPVNVTIKRLNTNKNEVYGYSINSMWGNNYGYMQFNFDKIDEAENMKITAGHEFFHLVQSLYDPRYAYSKAKSPMPNYWLDEASSVWSESFFSNTSNYLSPIFSDNVFDVFKGAKTGNEKIKSGEYGYGMASFIKYVTNKYGDSKLVEVYDNIYNGKSPFQSLSEILPINVGFSWHSYLKNLLSFDLYSGDSFRPGILSSYSTGEHQKFIIKSVRDSLATYKSQLSDLSATIFSVDNQFKEMSSGSILEFTCKDWKFQLYKITSSSSEMIESGKDILTVDNFKQLTEDGYKIIAVLYNDDYDSPFENNKEYEMEIRLKTQTKIKGIEIFITYDGTYQMTDNLGSDVFTYENSGFVMNTIGGNDRRTQINGNTITITEERDDQLVKGNSTTSVTFSDINNPQTIIDFSFAKTYDDKSNRKLSVESASGANIPFTFHEWSWSGDYNFSYEGNISQYVIVKEVREETVTIVASPANYEKIITRELLNIIDDSSGKISIDIEFEE